jgi:hypothetical protein
MTQVSGKIEDIGSVSKSIKGEDKEIHFIVVGGKKYEMGFYPASYGKNKPSAVGDEVQFDSEYKYGSNKVVYGTFKKAGSGGVALGNQSAPVNDGLRVRIAALHAAAQFADEGVSSEDILAVAKVFEGYLQGE